LNTLVFVRAFRRAAAHVALLGRPLRRDQPDRHLLPNERDNICHENQHFRCSNQQQMKINTT